MVSSDLLYLRRFREHSDGLSVEQVPISQAEPAKQTETVLYSLLLAPKIIATLLQPLVELHCVLCHALPLLSNEFIMVG